ncbi:ImmA/IrrE family metallo-endopeptidase [Bacillus mesophilum]|uniref:ImmA/IrrE family metallo-endopeptidase n=1 Tax=Bacillus mesophilum TaxID=1071718 RepID=A0A7V7UWK2_9BACI|nr:ImmA/IrrE family metallo-endopeptidase [Bacillus mesophilum]KAB2335046.1 ImmA/IrrE family metallo-endopeptidase [Bacillus mesophilum]
MFYQLTPLESRIKGLYEQFDIKYPEQIDMNLIANKLDIWIHYWDKESRMNCINGLYSIILSNRKPNVEQWEDFCHELGHVIRHHGNQSKMFHSFKNLQETQASNFMYHFAVPTFMLLDLKLHESMHLKDCVKFVSETFNVTYEFARVRLNHFKNQWLLAKSDAEHRAIMAARYPKAGPYMPETIDTLKQLELILNKKKGAANNA